MAYRTTRLRTVVADDSQLTQVSFDRTIVLNQVQDQQSFVGFKQVKPTDAEVQIPITPVLSGYYIDVRSDYPVLIRLNGSGATQFQMHGNNVTPTNIGAPLPDQCHFTASIAVTSVYLAPISGATQTANVKVVVTGDPVSAYV